MAELPRDKRSPDAAATEVADLAATGQEVLEGLTSEPLTSCTWGGGQRELRLRRRSRAELSYKGGFGNKHRAAVFTSCVCCG